ncbi:hypothetical protein [Cyclobacterium sp. SYSU L10401]|uniref:hypothetical protein n=1 Tax=Cyclobacterium sp. SYSU L10401 TaxID=2678657 RepID=UPI0013D22DBC|nr:hypothetical protein [Cyclobacterium sp. SYSU L10401]
MDFLLPTIFSATVMGAVVTVLLNLLFKKRLEQITHDIKIQTEKIALIQKSQYTWKEQAIAELLGPMNIHLNRTERAFKKLKANDLYVEAKILKDSNEKIRDMLLLKSHFIPSGLTEDADKLVEHYDRYLEKFEEKRKRENPDLDTPFIFVGPDGFPFPKNSAKRFQEEYTTMWEKVYGIQNEPKN